MAMPPLAVVPINNPALETIRLVPLVRPAVAMRVQLAPSTEV